MAAGSQLENGIWALLVMPAIIMVKVIIWVNEFDHIFVIVQWP